MKEWVEEGGAGSSPAGRSVWRPELLADDPGRCLLSGYPAL